MIRIYKISHKRKKDGKNLFPSFCYIGQHRGKDINERFRQHKNDAKNFERKEIKDKEGKHARLHEAMRISNPENFFIEELELSGEIDNTYIFFTSDHGIAIGKHGLIGKQNLYEHSWRIPLIVSGPKIKKNKKRPKQKK